MNDRISEYTGELRSLIDDTLVYRITDPARAIPMAGEIIEKAEENCDTFLTGLGYYCMADSYLGINRRKEFEYYVVRAISELSQTTDSLYTARCYNLIGINSFTNGIYSMAIDAYMTAVNHADDIYTSSLINLNVGELYMSLNDYETGLRYYSNALTGFMSCSDQQFSYENIRIARTEIGNCLFELGKYDKACKTGMELFRESDRGESYNEIAVMAFIIKVLHYKGMTVELEKCMKKEIDNICGTMQLADVWFDMLMFAEFLDCIKDDDNFNIVTEVLLELTEKESLENVRLRTIALQIKHEEKGVNEDKLRDLYRTFFHTFSSQQDANIKLNKDTLELRKSLGMMEEVRKNVELENRQLKNELKKDTLTGIGNRYYFNSVSTEILDNCISRKQNFGIEMLDVDDFKNYNDTYGHQTGDVILKIIAETISEMQDDSMSCSRYGGDEFVIIYRNKTDEQISVITSQLKKKVMQIKIPGLSGKMSANVTISQGICNMPAQHGNRVWDYLYSADAALYECKRGGKNRTLIKNNA